MAFIWATVYFVLGEGLGIQTPSGFPKTTLQILFEPQTDSSCSVQREHSGEASSVGTLCVWGEVSFEVLGVA
jgi:hypothetical protein